MIYLIYGEEQYLVKEELARIMKKYSGASVEKLSSPTFAELIELSSIPSLFSPNRLIIVEDLDLSQDDERFIPYLSSLAPNVALVIINPDGFDKRSKICKKIESLAEVHEFKPIPEWEESTIVDFVVKSFAKYGKKISRDNAYLIVDGVGRNMGLINSEVVKISTFVGDNTSIEKDDIEKLMIRGGWDAFSLSQAVLKRNKTMALVMLERLINDNEDPIGLLGLLSSQYRTLYKVKLLAQQGDSQAQIARRLKASPYYINRLYENSKDFMLDELQSGMELLYGADLKLKSGYSPKNELTLLIADLLQNA